MTPEVAKKYIADRKRISDRLFQKRKKRCIEKGGEYVPVKDAKGKITYKCDDSKKRARKAKARAKRLKSEYEQRLRGCKMLNNLFLRKKDYAQYLAMKIERLKGRHERVHYEARMAKRDEGRCLETARELEAKYLKAYKAAYGNDVKRAKTSPKKNGRDAKKSPKKKTESKSDPCAELRATKFNRSRDCQGRGYRAMMLRIHPDKNPQCKSIAKEKTQQLNKICRR